MKFRIGRGEFNDPFRLFVDFGFELFDTLGEVLKFGPDFFVSTVAEDDNDEGDENEGPAAKGGFVIGWFRHDLMALSGLGGWYCYEPEGADIPGPGGEVKIEPPQQVSPGKRRVVRESRSVFKEEAGGGNSQPN